MTDPVPGTAELTNAYDAYAKAIASGDQAAIMEALRRCQAAEARNSLEDQFTRLRSQLGYNCDQSIADNISPTNSIRNPTNAYQS